MTTATHTTSNAPVRREVGRETRARAEQAIGQGVGAVNATMAKPVLERRPETIEDFAYRFVIEGAPAVLKNSKRIVTWGKRPGLISSDRAIAYLEEATRQLGEQWDGPAIETPVNAAIVSYLPTRRRVDLSNSYQAVEDALQAAGVLQNDYLIAGHDGSRRRYDPTNPRVEVTLTPMEDEV